MLKEDIDEIIKLQPPGTGFKILDDVDGPGRKNLGIITREERPPEGGIYLHLLYYKYPYKGCPFNKSVWNLHTFKKSIFFALKAVQNRKIEILLGLMLILPKFLTRRILSAVVDYYYWMMDFLLKYDLVKPKRFCPCVREIHRAFTVLIGREEEEWKRKMLEMAREVLCMFLEFDSAYKFRFQDIANEIDPFLIRGENTMARELERLFDLLAGRERPTNALGDCMEVKWKRVKKMFVPPIKRIGFIRQMALDFFREVDLEKLKPDEGDRYFYYLRKDYEFFGKPLKERIQIRKKIEGENWRHFERLAQYFQEEHDILEEYKSFANYHSKR